jgi:hypothetical protein
MNLIRFIKFYFAFNKLNPIEKRILFLTYKNTNNEKPNNKEEPFSIIQQSISNTKSMFDSLDNYKQGIYQKAFENTIYLYNLLAMFEPDNPVYFYMLVW